MLHELTLPFKDDQVRAMHIGDQVLLSGTLLTARDAAHKWLVDVFIEGSTPPAKDDISVLGAIAPLLDHGAIYHCGPLISGQVSETGSTESVRFLSAGPTTSIREEPYSHRIMQKFHVSAVIGKGGMGTNTSLACHQVPTVYLHAVGGAGSLIAQTVQRVLSVHKLEFGIPEAVWVIEVKDFPAIVTMDAHGESLHSRVDQQSRKVLDGLLGL